MSWGAVTPRGGEQFGNGVSVCRRVSEDDGVDRHLPPLGRQPVNVGLMMFELPLVSIMNVGVGAVADVERDRLLLGRRGW